MCPYCGKHSGADRFIRRKANGLVATTLERVSGNARGEGLLTILSSLSQDESCPFQGTAQGSPQTA